MKNESGLKSKLMQQIKKDLPGFVALRHEDVRTSGIPDLSMTGLGRTSWYEFKHSAPTFKSSGIQELTMLRLAAAGVAWYVIWEENKHGIKRTLIVRPKCLTELYPEASCSGFDHKFIVGFMKKVHGV
jgi:hypothetical protein